MSTQNTSGSYVEPGGFYHVCFAVPDLHAAMAELADLVGVTFGQVTYAQLGPWPYSLVFTNESPAIELVSSVPGSPWETTTPAFHHLGWWTSCLPDTIEHWITHGGDMHFDGRTYDRKFAYVTAHQSGVRLEAVDTAQRIQYLNRGFSSPHPER